MKKAISIFTLIAVVAFSSCQKEETTIESLDLKANTNTEGFRTPNDPTPQEILETNLRWTSFMTAKILKYDINARAEVMALLQNGNDAIKLNDIVVDGTAFKSAFYGIVESYIHNPGDVQTEPDNDNTTPNPPPILPPGRSSTDSVDNEQAFLNYILNENCVELYFPKYLNFTGDFNITTTGHPLNTNNYNNGNVVPYMQPDQPLNEEDYAAIFVDVDTSYVFTNKNIIVARPYRPVFITPNDPCNYNEYSGINFTHFLDL